MIAKVALDTNVLACAEGVNDAARQALALALIEALPLDGVVVPVQVLGELHDVLTRKGSRTRGEARTIVDEWLADYESVETSASVLCAATELAGAHGLSIRDAVVLSAASEAGCRLLLSEDMQDGFEWRGVTAANPFGATRHPALVGLLARG